MSADNPKLSRRYVDVSFGQIHVRVAEPMDTRRRTLICFHLSPISGVVYDTWLQEMGKDRLTLAPDTPGYGMSDPPTSPPTISDFADTMIAVLDSFEVANTDVMGYHTGSKICVELARKYPERIGHLVLVSAPVYTDRELEKQQAAMGHAVEPRADGSHLLDMWQGMWEWRGPEQSPADIMAKFPDVIRGGEHRHWGHRAAFSYFYEDALDEVEQPILVLNTNDDLVEYTRRVAPLLRHGRVQELPDWGHGFLDHNTDATAKLVRDFLDS